jgi:hypothetical protein
MNSYREDIKMTTLKNTSHAKEQISTIYADAAEATKIVTQTLRPRLADHTATMFAKTNSNKKLISDESEKTTGSITGRQAAYSNFFANTARATSSVGLGLGSSGNNNNDNTDL